MPTQRVLLQKLPRRLPLQSANEFGADSDEAEFADQSAGDPLMEGAAAEVIIDTLPE